MKPVVIAAHPLSTTRPEFLATRNVGVPAAQHTNIPNFENAGKAPGRRFQIDRIPRAVSCAIGTKWGAGTWLGLMSKSMMAAMLGTTLAVAAEPTSSSSDGLPESVVIRTSPLLNGSGSGSSIGPIFGPNAEADVAAALKVEPVPNPDHPHVAENSVIKRRLGQLGLSAESPNLVLVDDIQREHRDMIVRQIGGKSGLVPRRAIRSTMLLVDSGALSAREPKNNVPVENAVDGAVAEGPSLRDLIHGEAAGAMTGGQTILSMGVMMANMALMQHLRTDDTPRKIFLNASTGYSLATWGHQLALGMIGSEEGSRLYQEASRALGRPPRRPKLQDGSNEIDFNDPRVVGDLNTLKRDVIFPLLEAEIKRPEYKEQVTAINKRTAMVIKAARARGIMVFWAAGNEHERERAVRYTRWLPSVDHPEGIFVVGAVDGKGPGADDDIIAPFTSAGNITAAGRGVDIPVDLDADGNALDVYGTSFAAPDMVSTAYYISAVAPHLTLDGIESVLTDPRVVTDIPNTTRDGAGSVDPFRAILVAKHPRLTREQLDAIIEILDRSPTQDFTINAVGAAVPVSASPRRS